MEEGSCWRQGRNFPVSRMAIKKRCGWRLSQRSEEDARMRARISEKLNSNRTVLGKTAYSLSHTPRVSSSYQVVKYFLSYFIISLLNDSICILTQICDFSLPGVVTLGRLQGVPGKKMCNPKES